MSFLSETGLRRREFCTLSIHNLLSERAISFIKKQLELHKDHKIYGIVGRRNKNFELIEYPFLFPFFDTKLKKWVRRDNFRKAFQRLIDKTIEQFSLEIENIFTVHDFRRSVNIWLRERGFNTTEASYWLGHTEKTNETNYLALSEKQRLVRENVFNKVKDFWGYKIPTNTPLK